MIYLGSPVYFLVPRFLPQTLEYPKTVAQNGSGSRFLLKWKKIGYLKIFHPHSVDRYKSAAINFFLKNSGQNWVRFALPLKWRCMGFEQFKKILHQHWDKIRNYMHLSCRKLIFKKDSGLKWVRFGLYGFTNNFKNNK